MFWKIIKKIILLILALLAVFLQFSFIPSLPPFFQAINLPLAALLVALIFLGLKEALVAALIFGFFLDSWHFSPFGIYLLTFLAIIIFAQIILTHWLTDRSLYSFAALTFFSSLVFSLVWNLLNFFFSWNNDSGHFFLFSWGFLKQTSFSVFWLVLIGGLCFIILSLTSNRLKPVFLKKR